MIKFKFDKKASEEQENYITVWLYPGSGASLYGFATVAGNEEEALENVADYLVEKQLHSFYMTPQEYQDFMKDYYDELSEEELEEKMENDETVMYVDTGRGAVVYLTGFENAKIENGINEQYIDDITIIDGNRAKGGPLSKWSKKSSKKVKSDKEKTIQEYEEMGLDTTDLLQACQYVHYGFYDEIKKKWSPEKLYQYVEERLKEAQDNPQTAKFEKNWTSTRFPEALKLILHWLDTNVETTWKDLDSKASKEVKAGSGIDFLKTLGEKERYMFLDRMKQDCKYYLDGNKLDKFLWAGNPKDQIECMKWLYNSFPEDKKPEWISMEDIERYEKEMINNNKSASLKRKANTPNFDIQNDYPLIALGNQQVLSADEFVEIWNEEHPEAQIKEYDDWKAEHEERYYDLMSSLFDERYEEMEDYIKNADIPYGWNITLKPGYYEGLQLWVEEPDDFEYNFENDWLYDNDLDESDLTPEQKAELQNAMQAQYEKEKAQVIQIMHDAAKACGWLELAVAYQFSNGETGYSIVKSGLNKPTMEMLHKTSNWIEEKNDFAILQDKITKRYSLFSVLEEDFVDDNEYDTLEEAQKALYDLTYESDNAYLEDLANAYSLEFQKVRDIADLLKSVSDTNEGEQVIYYPQFTEIVKKTGIDESDAEEITLDLGYRIK